MAKTNDKETFIIHVGTTIEQQLQKWDERYAVNIMKFIDYHFIVKHGETYYVCKYNY